MIRFPFVRVGLLFAFSPLVMAFVTGLIQGVSMWDEGSSFLGVVSFAKDCQVGRVDWPDFGECG